MLFIVNLITITVMITITIPITVTMVVIEDGGRTEGKKDGQTDRNDDCSAIALKRAQHMKSGGGNTCNTHARNFK